MKFVRVNKNPNEDKVSILIVVFVLGIFAFAFGGAFFAFETETTTCDASGCTIYIRQGARGKAISVKEFIPREDILNVIVKEERYRTRKGKMHVDFPNIIEHRDGRQIRLMKSTCFNYPCAKKRADKIMNGEYVEIW